MDLNLNSAPADGEIDERSWKVMLAVNQGKPNNTPVYVSLYFFWCDYCWLYFTGNYGWDTQAKRKYDAYVSWIRPWQ